MWPRLLTTALGIWLMAAPAVLGHTDVTFAEANDRIVGPLIASAAIAAIWDEIRPLRWVNVALGGWLVASGLVLGLLLGWPATAIVNDVLVGVAAVLLGRIRGPIDNRFGGGWRSLWDPSIDTIDGKPYG